MFKVKRRYRDYVLCYCNNHNDNTPSLSISLRPEFYGCYRCFGCGLTGRLSSNEMKELGCEVEKNKRPVLNIDWTSLYKDYNKKLIRECPQKITQLATLFNLDNAPTVLYDGIGWDGCSWTFPVFDSNGMCIGIQRRFEDGNKGFVSGSKIGILIDRQVVYSNQDTVFITEGISDLLSVADLDFLVAGRINCNTGVEELSNWLYNSMISRVVIIPDNDKVGIDGAEILQTRIILDSQSSIIPTIFSIKDSGCSDIRQYIHKFGKEYVRLELEDHV